MTDTKMEKRMIADRRDFSFRRFILQWEWLLVLMLILINILNSNLSPYYLDPDNILSGLQMSFDKVIMVFPMMLVILLGDIDVSVASTMALCGVSIGMLYNAGIPMWAAIAAGLAIGAACGLLNGLLIAKFKELSAVIITIATMIFYRGIASLLLEDGYVGNFPEWFKFPGWGNVGPIPFIILFVVVEGLIFAYVVHKTKFGRRVYAMGNNETTSRFSGIKTQKMRIIIFTLNGLFAAVAAIFLISKTGSARPNIAVGYELDVIAMVVLGGVSSAGGKGRVIGVALASLVIGLLRYGLSLANIPSQTIMIIIGLLLVLTSAIPNLKSIYRDSIFKNLFSKKKNI